MSDSVVPNSIKFDMSKLGVFGSICVEDGHAGDAVAVLQDGKITTASFWHKANIFRKLGRSGDAEEQNRRIRNAFLTALGSSVGLDENASHADRLSRLRSFLGEDADVLTGFQLGADGQVKTTRPLTERRISLIVDKMGEHADIELGPRVGIHRNQRMQRLFDEAKTQEGNFVSSILKSSQKLAAKSPLFRRMCDLGLVDRLCMLQIDALIENKVLAEPSVAELAKCNPRYLIASTAGELGEFFKNNILNTIDQGLLSRADDEWKALSPALSHKKAEEILLHLPDGEFHGLCREVFSFCAGHRIEHAKENPSVTPITLDSEQRRDFEGAIKKSFESDISKEYEGVRGGLQDFSEILDEPEKHVDWLMRELPELKAFKKDLDKSLADLPDEKLVKLLKKSDRRWASCIIPNGSQGCLSTALSDEFKERHKVVTEKVDEAMKNYIKEKHPDFGLEDGRTREVIDNLRNVLKPRMLPSFVDELFDHTFDMESDSVSKKVGELLEQYDLGEMIESEFAKVDDKTERLIQECDRQKAATEQVIARIEGSQRKDIDTKFAAKLIRADLAEFDAALKGVPKNAGSRVYRNALEHIYGKGYEGIVNASGTLFRNGLADDCRMLLGYASAFAKNKDFNNEGEFKTTREHSDLYALAAKMQPVINKLRNDVFGGKGTIGVDQTQDIGGKAFALALSHVLGNDADLKSWFNKENYENEVSAMLQDYMSDRTQVKGLKNEPSVMIDFHMAGANEGDTLDMDVSGIVGLLRFGVTILNHLQGEPSAY